MTLLDSKVLFVEDENILREKMQKFLNMFFLQPIDAVATADEALEKFKNSSYDLIISDIKVPGNLNGLDFIEKAKELNPNIKTIIITGFNQDVYNERAKELHVNKYFVKPVTVSDILEEITNLGFSLQS